MASILKGEEGQWPEGKQPNWVHVGAGMDGGRFGAIEHRVMVDTHGNPLFDRAVVVEGPHIITVTWGFCPQTGVPRLGLVNEVRDTAAPADGLSTLSFWGPPRGFRDNGETPEVAARREAGEEAGVRAFLGTRYIGDIFVNETCVASCSPVVEVHVDLTQLGAITPDLRGGEKIFKAAFFTEEEVKAMILAGTHEGALTTSGVLATILLYWQLHVLAKLPQPAAAMS